jgi:hypothetical protein
MEESILHIKLMKLPILGVSESKNGADCGWLDDGTESLLVVDSGPLSETAEDPAGFVAIEGTVSMKLVTENPFASDNVCLSGALNKVPGVVIMKGGTFFFHGLAPVGVSQGFTVRARDG